MSVYDAAADSYDAPALSFRNYFGEQSVARAQLQPGQIVLDVCSGTGASAIPAARAVAPEGRVIGLDISPALTVLARAKAPSNCEFRVADFDQAYFRNASFDAVICVFGIFFFPDMAVTLKKMWRILRPGGRLVVTTWGSGLFEPASTVFWDAVREVRPDLYTGTHRWDCLDSPGKVRALFERAGIPEVRIEMEGHEHRLNTAEDFWTIVNGSGSRAVIDQLTADEREHVRAACLRIKQTTLPAPVIYGRAACQ